MAQQFSDGEYQALRYFIGDVRDEARLRRALEGIDIVIHAAALKQVPAAEYNPFECIKTNVLGAQNLIEACLDSGVQRVVALSTDKAAAPINLYGATKLCSDKLFVAANNIKRPARPPLQRRALRQRDGQPRLGDPVLPRAPQAAGVLPITDPTMTRFNITLAGRRRHGAVVASSTPGAARSSCRRSRPTAIIDVATAIGPDCEHKLVGIRPGEKIHEEMITASDSFNTVDLGAYFAILPAGGAYSHRRVLRAGAAASRWRRASPTTAAATPTSSAVEQLRALIRQHVDADLAH